MVYLLVGKTIPKGAQTPRPCFVHIEDPPRVSPQQKQRGAFRSCEFYRRGGRFLLLLYSLALCPNTSKTRPKARQKRPKTGANVVLFRRNLLNFCILLIRPKHGQTKTRGGASVSGFRAGGEYCTRGGQNTRPAPTIRRAALRLCPFGAALSLPLLLVGGAGLQCSEIHDERTTHGRGLGGALRLCPRSRVHVSPLSFL